MAVQAPMTNLANYQTQNVISPGMLQQQMNSALARNQGAVQGQERRSTEELAGRGMGAMSPLARAMQAQIRGRGIATAADIQRELMLNAAQLNAEDARQRGIAQLQSDTAQNVAGQQAAASRFGSEQARIASMYGSDIGKQSALGVAGIQSQASRYGVDIGSQTSKQIAQLQAESAKQLAQMQDLTSRYGIDVGSQTSLKQSQAALAASILSSLFGMVGGLIPSSVG